MSAPRITKRTVDGLRAGTSEYFHWDSDLSGFGVRVRPTGAKSYVLKYRAGIALLAVCPIRLKNFAALALGTTFKEVDGRWWIVLPASATKSRRAEERCVPEWLNAAIEVYLNQSRPVLLGSEPPTNALWVSSSTGCAMTAKNLGTLISRVTLQTVGVYVSPHLFRTAAASTAAVYGGNTPYLASAVLNHTDPQTAEEHYNRASSMRASQIYSEIITDYLRTGGPQSSSSE